MVRVLIPDTSDGNFKELDLTEYLQDNLKLDISVVRGNYGSRLSIRLLLDKESRYPGFYESVELCEDSVDIKDILEG